jgi:cell division septation protein DedD
MVYNLGQIDPEQRTGYYREESDEDEPPRPRRLWRIGAALLVMAAFAGGLWGAYLAGTHYRGSSGETGGDVPLIRADTSPFKLKPQNPGGMQIPDRDLLIYGAQQPQVEHLLPPPEQPMARPAPPPAPEPPAAPAAAAAGAAAVATSSGAAALALAEAAPGSAPPAAAGSATAPAAASSPSQAATTPAPDSDPIGERIEQLAAAAASPAPTPGSGAKPAGLRVQLGAVRSAGEARGEWERLRRNNADLLGKLSGVAVRADLGDKGVYYRIQAGPVASPAAADHICSELRQRRLPCIIVR